jgi:hypothetical protein
MSRIGIDVLRRYSPGLWPLYSSHDPDSCSVLLDLDGTLIDSQPWQHFTVHTVRVFTSPDALVGAGGGQQGESFLVAAQFGKGHGSVLIGESNRRFSARYGSQLVAR